MSTPSEARRDLPVLAVTRMNQFWRAYRIREDDPNDEQSAWFFASVSDYRHAYSAGRFDLHDPHGTCYLADDPAAAYREHFQAYMVDPADEQGHALARAVTAETVHFGDLASPDAEAAGFTLEEAATDDRPRTQGLATRAYEQGLDGIRALRHTDPSGRTHTIGLFDDAGAYPDVPGWVCQTGMPLVRPGPVVRVPESMPLAEPPQREPVLAQDTTTEA